MRAMWEALKNVVTAAKDVLGLELPELAGELPTDVAAMGDAASTVAQGAADSAVGALEPLSAAAEGAAGDLAGVAEAAPSSNASAAESATASVPDLSGALDDAAPSK
jgi:hypothetical protein